MHFGQPSSHPRLRQCGQTLAEVLVAVMLIGLSGTAALGLLLKLNQNAANVRVMNLAKAAVMSRIQQVSVPAYNPTGLPPVVPTALNLGTTTTTTDIGSTSSPLGSVPASIVWSVTAQANAQNVPIRRVSCRINYQFQNRTQSYEMVTFRAPD